MLTVSNDFISAVQNDTLALTTRVRWWFSWNHLLEPTVTTALNDIIDEDLFPAESVLNGFAQTTSGSAYAVVGEAYTSSDPRYGFRLAPADAEINPIAQFTTRTAGSNGGTAMTRIDVDYGQEVDSNVIEIQLETLRRSDGRFHTVNVEVFIKNAADSWVSVYDGRTEAEGRRVLYYNGSAWGTSEQDYSSTQTIKGVRLEIHDTTVAVWNPKVRYIGAHNVVDVSDDVVSWTVNKSEAAQSSYMPFGDPMTNTASLVLDNTAQDYAYKPVGETQPYYDMNMRIDIELGADLSYVGGSGIEYVKLGTYYTDGMSYSTEMDLSLEMSDYSKFFQRKFLDDCFWEDKSYQYIIKDILARTGFDAGRADFVLGETKLVNETQTTPYAWYKSETLIWDALSDIVKSELGTFFVNEDNSFTFTDRHFLNVKKNNGIQWTIDADIDLEIAQQDFTIDANEVEVAWTKTGKNVDNRGIVYPEYTRDDVSNELELSYTTSGPIEISSVLWEPGEALVLNAATLYESMDDSQDYIRLDRPLGDTFPETGIINVNGEYMEYDGKLIKSNYVELQGLTRGVRDTTAAAHDNGDDQKTALDGNYFSYYPYDAAEAPTITTTIEDGKYVIEQACTAATNTAGDDYNTFTAFRPFGTHQNPSAQDYAYGCRFYFEDFSNSAEESNMAGMFVHAKTSTWGGSKDIIDTYWIEVVSATEMVNQGFITGSLRVFRTSDNDSLDATTNTIEERSGLPPTTENAIYGHDSLIIVNGQPINLDVYWDYDNETFNLYVNDVFMTSWQASYLDGELGHPDAQSSPHRDNYYEANLTGYWGIYVRGNTKAAFEYAYAGDIDRASESYVADYLYGGFVDNNFPVRASAEKFREFGSIAHELRRFEVEHQVWPNRWVRIFHSNQLEAKVVYQNHNSFRSEFEILNVSRTPAVLVGNDESPYNFALGANHQFFIYGGTVIEIEAGEQIARDQSAIRKRGISNVRIESPWVQSEDHAKRLSNWVKNNWAEPVDFYTINWFPMWALQPGDAVEVDYPEKGF